MSRRKKSKHRSGPAAGMNPASNGASIQRGGGTNRPSGPLPPRQANAEPRVIQADSPEHPRGQIPIQSVMVPRRNIYKKQMHQRNNGAPTKRYGVVFYETLQSARNDVANLEKLALQYDQLNIVIRAELATETPELNQFGKVFAGAAWALIHERRKQDGWYEEPHE